MMYLRGAYLAASFFFVLLKPSPQSRITGAPTSLVRSAKPIVVHVIAHDYAFEAPEVARAGLVTFDFENRGEKDHELLVGLLRPGMGASDIVAAHQKGTGFSKLQDAYLDGAAPGVLFATPHTRSPATFTLPFVAGRTYVLLCQLRDSVGATQHAAMGMFRFMHATR